MFIRPTFFQPLISTSIEYFSVQYVPAADGSTDVLDVMTEPAPLPSYPTMSIDSLLRAGVPLEKVNPHILGDSKPSEDYIIDTVLGLKTPTNQPTNQPTTEPASPAPTDHL